MKTQTFETSKGKLYVVDLPEGFVPKLVKYVVSGLWIVDSAAKTLNADKFKLPPGDWQEIGLWGRLSEERAMEVVPDPIRLQDVFENRYFLYTREWAYLARTALESLISLLETGIKLVNTVPHPDEFHLPSRSRYIKLMDEYQTAESQVWKNPFLMFKTK